MERTQIKELLERYLAGNCTEEEKAWVETWYNRQSPGGESLPEDILESDLEEIYDSLPGSRSRSYLRNNWLHAAAVLVLLIASAGLYFYLNRSPGGLPEGTASRQINTLPDIAPGGNKALLTLADGTSISLDDAGNGTIAEQNGIMITKTRDGQLTYTAKQEQSTDPQDPKYNTIRTPKGGQYQIVLPDGTRVWLNAASSLKYPTAFTGGERRVTLTGEAYFEVTSNRDLPFRVVSEDQVVEVLGTHFNINSYPDEPSVRTTLVEGSVKVIEKRTNSSMVLEPGEQSRLSSSAFSVAAVDTGREIAWKSGLFQFQGSDIRNVMRQLSRWYDVDVEFEGEIPDIQLWGEVYRNVNASQALEILAYFNLRYRITEAAGRKKIIIY